MILVKIDSKTKHKNRQNGFIACETLQYILIFKPNNLFLWYDKPPNQPP